MTDTLPVYPVTVSREDSLWVAVVDGIEAGATDVELFDELPDAVRDLIVTLLDIPPDSFWLDWHYRLGAQDLTGPIERLRGWEDLAANAARGRDASRLAAVSSMHGAGLSYREIADVIGISHQRVGQLMAGPVVDVAWPAQTGVHHEKWVERLRNTTIQDAEGQPSPVEAALVTLLDSALRMRPDLRRDLLTATASVLADAARDKDFLRAGA